MFRFIFKSIPFHYELTSGWTKFRNTFSVKWISLNILHTTQEIIDQPHDFSGIFWLESECWPMQTGQIVIFLWMFNEISLSGRHGIGRSDQTFFFWNLSLREHRKQQKTSMMNRKRGIIFSVICILCLTPLPRFNVTNARMIWKLYASIDTNKSY